MTKVISAKFGDIVFETLEFLWSYVPALVFFGTLGILASFIYLLTTYLF